MGSSEEFVGRKQRIRVDLSIGDLKEVHPDPFLREWDCPKYHSQRERSRDATHYYPQSCARVPVFCIQKGPLDQCRKDWDLHFLWRPEPTVDRYAASVDGWVHAMVDSVPCKMKYTFAGRILHNHPYQKGRVHGKSLSTGKWEKKRWTLKRKPRLFVDT